MKSKVLIVPFKESFHLFFQQKWNLCGLQLTVDFFIMLTKAEEGLFIVRKRLKVMVKMFVFFILVQSDSHLH
jgi:hypothetical protein